MLAKEFGAGRVAFANCTDRPFRGVRPLQAAASNGAMDGCTAYSSVDETGVMDQWCQDNCDGGNCPDAICKCADDLPAQEAVADGEAAADDTAGEDAEYLRLASCGKKRCCSSTIPDCVHPNAEGWRRLFEECLRPYLEMLEKTS